jgi:hypothetical protein
MAVNKDLRGFLQFLLLLLVTIQLADAELPPRVKLPASDILEVLDPIVILKGSEATISGTVQPSIPWAETDWGHLQVALFDDRGDLIKRAAVDYSPRPVPHHFHSAYQPRSYFFVTIPGITRSVRSVEISYRDGSISHLKSIDDDD